MSVSAGVTSQFRHGAWRRDVSTLADLRDTLLSKVISGELQIKQAEEVIKEAE